MNLSTYKQNYRNNKRAFSLTGSYTLDIFLKFFMSIVAIIIGAIAYLVTKNSFIGPVVAGVAYFGMMILIRQAKHKRLKTKGTLVGNQPVYQQQQSNIPYNQSENQ